METLLLSNKTGDYFELSSSLMKLGMLSLQLEQDLKCLSALPTPGHTLSLTLNQGAF
jgi:hypothetical protein